MIDDLREPAGVVTVSGDAKDHKVTCQLTLSTNDYNEIKACLPPKYFDKVETRREIAIMQEVMRHEGNDMIQKIDNTIKDWETSKQESIKTDQSRYKLRYRY